MKKNWVGSKVCFKFTVSIGAEEIRRFKKKNSNSKYYQVFPCYKSVHKEKKKTGKKVTQFIEA